MKTVARLAIFSALMVLLQGRSFSDTLFLNNGVKISGTYEGGSGGYIRFRSNDGTVKSYPLSMIQWIHFIQIAPASTGPSTSPATAHPVPVISQGQSPVVPSTTGSDVSQAQAQLALDFHNARRRDVGVPPLQWSAELAAYAQKWANHLAADNDCGLDHTVNNSYGENLFGGHGLAYTVLYASQDWYSEIKGYKYGVLTDENWYATGHYTQMIWSKTTAVGMGQANCSGGGTVIAAEYSPPGNYIGQSPY